MGDQTTDYYAICEETIKNDMFLNKINDPNAVESNIQSIQDKISTLDEKMLFVLEEYKKYYVFLHKNPEYPDYQQNFANAQANLTKIGSQFFETANQIDINTDLLNKKLICLNAMIVKEKRQNVFLKKRLGIVENKSNASSELIYDYTQIYDEGYLRNWALIISIIIVGIAIKNIYGNANGDLTSNVKNIANNVTNIGNNMYNNVKNMGTNMGTNMGSNYK
jgi:hypothetical protein